MKIRDNAQKLLDWLNEGMGRAATVAQIAAAGLMTSRNASDSVQYALRYKAVEPVEHHRGAGNEKVQYRATGRSLPAAKPPRPGPSFDELLQAWGISCTPPSLETRSSRTIQAAD